MDSAILTRFPSGSATESGVFVCAQKPAHIAISDIVAIRMKVFTPGCFVINIAKHFLLNKCLVVGKRIFFPLKVTEDKTADVITLTAVKAASQKCREDPNGIKQGVGIDITVELAVIGIRAVFPNEVKSLGCIGFGADINRKRTESLPLSCSEIMHHEKTANVFVNQCQQFRNEAANRKRQPVFIKE